MPASRQRMLDGTTSRHEWKLSIVCRRVQWAETRHENQHTILTNFDKVRANPTERA
jgi:hypothetical protein